MAHSPIITALLSYGMSGEVFHAPLIVSNPNFQLKSVGERSIFKVNQRYPSVKSVKSYADILNDESVELVVVNTPNETHYSFTKEALEAGKHVIVEKPFTVTAEEANQLIALSKEKKKILTVFQSRRWDGAFLTLQQVVKDGAVGKVVEFEAHYDRFRNYIEPNTWKEEAKPGTGILYNLGSHMLDQAIVLLGMPDEVDARVGAHRPGGKVADYYDIRLTYKDILVIVKSSYLVKEQGPRYILHGTEGSFVKYGDDPQEQALKDGQLPGINWGLEDKKWWGKLNSTVNGVAVEEKVETLPGNYPAFYQNIFEAIREGKPLAVKPEESRDVIRLIEMCYESNQLRKAIKVSA
jgi:scyllo-inositol 2-dehydrogenase (NADP+)